ncbi:MAG: hypothetical protein ACP5N1_06405 [Candidatus Woesearchaeota archaeon]
MSNNNDLESELSDDSIKNQDSFKANSNPLIENDSKPDSKKGFFKYLSKQYHTTLDLIVKNKSVNLALVTGTVTSVTFNILSTYYADTQGLDTSGIEWVSYWGETFAHAAVSTGTFLYFSKQAGKSLKKSLNELLFKITPVTFAISILPYRLARNEITDYLLSGGMPPEGATPIAQLALLVPYAITVNYALKLINYYSNHNKDKNSLLNKDNSPWV